MPAKLPEAETQWAEMIRAEAETQRTAIFETQATIRAEIVFSGGRPMRSNLHSNAPHCGSCWCTNSGPAIFATINALVGAATLPVAYWGFRFGVPGVYISGRTREKVSAATGQDAPGVIEKLVKAVVKKR